MRMGRRELVDEQGERKALDVIEEGEAVEVV